MSDDHSDADTESTGTAQDDYSPAMERLSQLSQSRADRESENESDRQPPLKPDLLLTKCRDSRG